MNYEKLKGYGLNHEDICKPLFCWMIAQLYSKNNGLNLAFLNDWNSEMRKTALYFEFIYGLSWGRIEPQIGHSNARLEKKIFARNCSTKTKIQS